MTIIPSKESTYRRKIRRRLTLDLCTRYGEYWTFIDAMREQWRVDPIVAVPPEPDFHAEVVGLLDRYQMPERFHMPPYDVMRDMFPGAYHVLNDEMLSAAPRTNVGLFLRSIKHIWKELIALPGARRLRYVLHSKNPLHFATSPILATSYKGF